METLAIAAGTIIVIRFIKSLIAESDRIDEIIDEELGPKTIVPESHWTTLVEN